MCQLGSCRVDLVEAPGDVLVVGLEFVHDRFMAGSAARNAGNHACDSSEWCECTKRQ